jgi:hypothetical protein
VKSDALHEACAQNFDHGFLRCPSSGKTHGGIAMPLGVFNLSGRITSLKKLIAVAFDHAADAIDFNDVCSDANDHSKRLTREIG